MCLEVVPIERLLTFISMRRAASAQVGQGQFFLAAWVTTPKHHCINTGQVVNILEGSPSQQQFCHTRTGKIGTHQMKNALSTALRKNLHLYGAANYIGYN